MGKSKGVTQIALAIVVGLIFLAIVLPIGLSVWQSTLGAVAPTSSWSAAANSSYASTNTNVNSGFSLMAIAPLVLAAGGVIGLLILAFTKFRG